MEKICPRCGEKFECRHEDIACCGCSRVKLGQAARAHIAKAYGDQCLCVQCLQEMEAETLGKSKQ